MKTIRSYSLELHGDSQIVKMPQGADVLTAQADQPPWSIYIWAIVEPGALPQVRRFRVIETGASIDFSVKRYLSTVRVDGGLNAFHVFEEVS